ncbi:MAG: hypothetical protein MSS13_06220 [Sutterella parvirubra]|nr:hypothetical protein [Sutterella parvirubra]MDY5201660.1 hypothetical protein [Sutterella parvirubra]
MTISRSTLAAALASALIPLSASAVSLGDLTVESRPGEPLDAVLMIDDVDMTVSPLLVRVAPPATYLREGVQWPEQAQDLRITKDRATSGVSVRVVGDEKLDGTFPLLIELNAGGAVTVRQYEISAVDGVFRVTPVAERTTVRPASEVDAADAKAEAEEAKTADAKEAKAEQKPRRRQGRWAPLVVQEYVAEHGFDASKPFKVGRDMTLWSIAKLYHPGYAGATMEQTLVAFMEKNAQAFPSGDASSLTVGAELVPPTADEVFSIDPEEAFRKIRGNEAVPPVTAQLIEAQKRSRAFAAEVAKVQQAERDAGRGPDAAAAAGAALLAAAPTKADAAQRTDETAGETTTGAVEQMAVPTTLPAEASVGADTTATTEGAAAPAGDAQDEETLDAGSIVATGSDVPDTGAAPETGAGGEAAADAKTESAAQTEPAAEPEKKGFDAAWLAVIAAVLGLFLILRRRKDEPKDSEGGCGTEKKGPAVVKLSRDVPKTSDAQITALKATVDEAVKNGTTGGAMGAGAMAYQAAQREEAMKAEAEKSTEAAKAEKADAPQDLYEKQPWLVPDEGMDAIAKAPAMPVSALDEARLNEAASAVSALDLTEKPSASTLAAEPAPKPAKPAMPGSNGEAVPLFKVSATMRPVRQPMNPAAAPASAVQPEAKPAEPAAPEVPEAPEEKRSPKEQALSESMEAQLKLAESFIGLGALPEAKELLTEVIRHGLEPQRRRAEFLMARIESADEKR